MCGHLFLQPQPVFADVILIREAEFTTNSMSNGCLLLGGATCRDGVTWIHPDR